MSEHLVDTLTFSGQLVLRVPHLVLAVLPEHPQHHLVQQASSLPFCSHLLLASPSAHNSSMVVPDLSPSSSRSYLGTWAALPATLHDRLLSPRSSFLEPLALHFRIQFLVSRCSDGNRVEFNLTYRRFTVRGQGPVNLHVVECGNCT